MVTELPFKVVDVDDRALNKLIFTVRAQSAEAFRTNKLQKELIKRAKTDHGFMNAAIEPQFTGTMKVKSNEDGEESPDGGIFEAKVVVTTTP